MEPREQVSLGVPLTIRQVSERMAKYRLSENELELLAQIDLSAVKPEEYSLIEKYNAYILYQNISDEKQYEAAVLAAKEAGPSSYYQPTEEYTYEDYTDPESFILPTLASDNGKLYDIFDGPTDPNDRRDSTFLFTSDGVVPLSEEGSRLLGRYAINKDTPLDVMFGLEGDRETIMRVGGRNQTMPQFTRGPGREPDLPPGVVRGIPEGEDASDYISVGQMVAEQGKLGGGDPYLYIKILDRRKGEITETRNVGEQIPIYPQMVDPPEKREPMIVEGAAPLPIPEEALVESSFHEHKSVAPYPRKSEEEEAIDPITGEDVVTDDEGRPPKDRLFAANLLANVAKGLEAWNLEGVNIPVPDYIQERYQGGQLGPAVQNLFRGR